MKVSKIIFIAYILLSPVVMTAQQMVRGVVKDAATGEALPFAAVAIKGTTVGNSTDFEGKYTLKIPAASKFGTLVISCIGYKPEQVALSTVKADQELTSSLQPVVNAINEVAVSAKSRLPHTIVMRVIDNIAANYPVQPFNYVMTYHDESQSIKGNKTRDIELFLFDKTGYASRDAFSAFRNRNYKIVKSTSNTTIRTIGDATTLIDELLLHDVARYSGNILQPGRLNDFDIKIDRITVIDGDSAWVLSYENKHPGLLSTSDWNASKSTGSLVVKMSDYAVLKHTVNTRTRLRNELDQSMAVDSLARGNSLREVSYTVETSYTKSNGKYTLKQISYSSPSENLSASVTVTNVKTEAVQEVVGREY